MPKQWLYLKEQLQWCRISIEVGFNNIGAEIKLSRISTEVEFVLLPTAFKHFFKDCQAFNLHRILWSFVVSRDVLQKYQNISSGVIVLCKTDGIVKIWKTSFHEVFETKVILGFGSAQTKCHN